MHDQAPLENSEVVFQSFSDEGDLQVHAARELHFDVGAGPSVTAIGIHATVLATFDGREVSQRCGINGAGLAA